MKKRTPDSISKNIRKYRLLNHMTQEQLAELLELDTQYYAQLERGERNFTIEKIIRICQIFQIGIQDIIKVESVSSSDTSSLIQQINNQLQSLTHSQLVVVEKFVQEITPFVR